MIPTERPQLFHAVGVRACSLTEDAIPALQRFFEDNPLYFSTVNGQPPRTNEAREEFDDLPPAHMPFTGRWLIGLVDAEGQLIGMASVLSDFLAEGVWHIGLFIVSSTLHGQGIAKPLYQAMEGWTKQNGARWLRLGAVVGNARAEHFWPKMGFQVVRMRHGVQTGLLSSTLKVFVKPLAEAGIDEYLALVARDRPDSSLS